MKKIKQEFDSIDRILQNSMPNAILLIVYVMAFSSFLFLYYYFVRNVTVIAINK